VTCGEGGELGRLGLEERSYPPRELLSEALRRVQAVDASAVAEAALARGASGPAIGEAIRDARIEALRELAPPG